MYSLDDDLQQRSKSSTDGERGEHSDREVSKSASEEDKTVADDPSALPLEKEIPQLTLRAVSESSNLRKAIQVSKYLFENHSFTKLFLVVLS